MSEDERDEERGGNEADSPLLLPARGPGGFFGSNRPGDPDQWRTRSRMSRRDQSILGVVLYSPAIVFVGVYLAVRSLIAAFITMAFVLMFLFFVYMLVYGYRDYRRARRSSSDTK